GKTAHASAEPEKGINALDGVIQTYNGISALRQHISSDARIHGVITHGGVKPNIVPDYASASFYIRALKDAYCNDLVKKVENIAKGAALITGAELTFQIVGNPYRSRNVNFILGEAWAENLKSLGLPIHQMEPGAGLGSSDVGNVSHEIPTIHPYIGISEIEINSHSTDFAKAAISDYGQNQMLFAAKGLAMTAFDVFTNTDLVKKMNEEFKQGE
ncbi:MAG: peptidase dimerization domain-containing protein, partial [Candidatus Heimdallarchaeaceae archaeon]